MASFDQGWGRDFAAGVGGEMALAAVQAALDRGYKDLITLETHPDLDPVREGPAFKKRLEKVSAAPSPGSAPDANR
jgi:hypothetical protein